LARKEKFDVIIMVIYNNAVTVLCAVRRTEENVIQRKHLRNIMSVLCAVRKWVWNAGR
jgi:hypothetical protein